MLKKKKTTTKPHFSSCTRTLRFHSWQAEATWEELFSHRECTGLLYQIPSSSSAFHKSFSPYAICLRVYRKGKQIMWKQRYKHILG